MESLRIDAEMAEFNLKQCAASGQLLKNKGHLTM
jgi:hypothetical protein